MTTYMVKSLLLGSMVLVFLNYDCDCECEASLQLAHTFFNVQSSTAFHPYRLIQLVYSYSPTCISTYFGER